ncbi:MAG: helix-turn-helix domain-containing protein [Planctomycetia bacterium]|nr:helix-turn-helix domain-containing protein [Planctomycetia bacterium]
MIASKHHGHPKADGEMPALAPASIYARPAACVRLDLDKSGRVASQATGPRGLIADNLAQAGQCISPWMRPQEAASYLGIALGTLRNLTSARVIPFARRGRIVRYHREALDRWLMRRSCPGRATMAQSTPNDGTDADGGHLAHK